jgi:hypothetical protein
LRAPKREWGDGRGLPACSRRKSNEEGHVGQHALSSTTTRHWERWRVRPMELYGRPYVQCVTCQRAWSLRLKSGRLQPARGNAPTATTAPPNEGPRRRINLNRVVGGEMSRFTGVLFDLDGTLVDPGQGIAGSLVDRTSGPRKRSKQDRNPGFKELGRKFIHPAVAPFSPPCPPGPGLCSTVCFRQRCMKFSRHSC